MGIKYEDTLKVSSAGAMVIEYPIAGLGSRAYAYLIDWHMRIILILAWWILVYLFAKATNLIEGEFFKLIFSSGEIIGYAIVLPSVLIYFLYNLILEVLMKGRTPGKRIAGIRIVSLDGTVPGLSAIIVRNIFRLIDFLPSLYLVGIATCFLTKNQVRIGDLAAHTLLIHEEVMEHKAIELMSAASHRSGLSVPQIEVLHDLLKRWKQLERGTRLRLGNKLLEAANKSLPENESGSVKYVVAALRDLSRGKND